MSKNWIVSVTREGRRHQVYACVPAPSSAERLAELARSLGYKDVSVFEEKAFKAARSEKIPNATKTKVAKNVTENKEKAGSGKVRKTRTNKKAQKVHDLPEKRTKSTQEPST